MNSLNSRKILLHFEKTPVNSVKFNYLHLECTNRIKLRFPPHELCMLSIHKLVYHLRNKNVELKSRNFDQTYHSETKRDLLVYEQKLLKFSCDLPNLFASRLNKEMNSEERYDKSHTFTSKGGEITLNDDKTIRLNVPKGTFKRETLVKCKCRFVLFFTFLCQMKCFLIRNNMMSSTM